MRPPHSQQQPFRPLQFDNPQLAFASKSTGELMRAYAVFTACQVCTKCGPLIAVLRVWQSHKSLFSACVGGA